MDKVQEGNERMDRTELTVGCFHTFTSEMFSVCEVEAGRRGADEA